MGGGFATGTAQGLAWFAALAMVCWRLIASDLRTRTLSHVDTVLFNVLVLVAVLVPGDAGAVSLPVSLATGLAAGGLAAGLYQAGQLGGGDVKLIPAIAAAVTRFGSTAWLVYLGVLVVTGLAVLVWWRQASDPTRARGLPLGPVLLVGLVPGVVAGLLRL